MQIIENKQENIQESIKTDNIFLRHKITIFYLITFLWAYAIWIPMALHALNIIYFPIPIFIGQTIGAFSPLGTLLIMEKLTKKKVSTTLIFKRKGEGKLNKIYIVLSIVLFPLLAAFASVLHFWLNTGTPFEIIKTDIVGLLGWWLIGIIPLVFVAGLLSSPLLEEPGWRGFALPSLQERVGRFGASFIVGSMWCLWHIPINIANGLMPDISFYFGIVGTSFIIDSLFNGSKQRIIAAMFCHSATFVCQTFFTYTNSWEMIVLQWVAVVIIRAVQKYYNSFAPSKIT